MPTRRAVVSAEDRAFLEAVARRTWGYFDTFVGADDHALPPDNVQLVPEPFVEIPEELAKPPVIRRGRMSRRSRPGEPGPAGSPTPEVP